METTFRWRSWLGASVIFFLIFGVINVGLAIAVPATLHLNGSFSGVVFGAGDAQLLGRSFAGLRHDNPKLDMILATAWFGLRRGGPWAFWALLLSGLLALVYYFVISADYARQGAAWADGLMTIVEFSIPLFLGIIAGGIAFRRGLHA